MTAADRICASESGRSQIHHLSPFRCHRPMRPAWKATGRFQDKDRPDRSRPLAPEGPYNAVATRVTSSSRYVHIASHTPIACESKNDRKIDLSVATPPDFPSEEAATSSINPRAATLLNDGLKTIERTEGVSVRELAIELGFRNSVALSHMASGGIPVPIDRCIDIAARLHIPEASFLLAVLDQHYPEIDFRRIILNEP